MMKQQPDNKSKYQKIRHCSRNISGTMPMTIATSISQSYIRDDWLSFLASTISFTFSLQLIINSSLTTPLTVSLFHSILKWLYYCCCLLLLHRQILKALYRYYLLIIKQCQGSAILSKIILLCGLYLSGCCHLPCVLRLEWLLEPLEHLLKIKQKNTTINNIMIQSAMQPELETLSPELLLYALLYEL